MFSFLVKLSLLTLQNEKGQNIRAQIDQVFINIIALLTAPGVYVTNNQRYAKLK